MESGNESREVAMLARASTPKRPPTQQRDRIGARATTVGALTMSLALAACSAAPISSGRKENPSPTRSSPEAGPSMSRYRDGTYQARGWYGGLPSHHDVMLTIADDIVTDVRITTPAQDETSLGYQRRFADALPDAIIGRSINELDVDRLAGSSGCSQGFMNAIAKIKADAQS